jgi:hypothetical protein
LEEIKMSMKLNKVMSGLAAPTASTPGFLGEIGQNVNSVIVVGFADFEVYGKLNDSWVAIDLIVETNEGDHSRLDGSEGFLNRDGTRLSSVPGNIAIDLTQYEDVYFVSKSGAEEVMRFFYVEDAIVSPASFSKASSLEDISDMPAFTQADAGKVLSINAQGNLTWVTR